MRLAIIPARSGSTRIKDKNVTDFCGRPMIAYPLQAARESGLFDTIHVSTESAHYTQIVCELGFEVDFLRDPALADDQTVMTEVLRWVVAEYEQRGQRFDDLCMILATAPLIDGDDLWRGCELFAVHGCTTLVLVVTTFAALVERVFKIGTNGILERVFSGVWLMHF